MEILATLRRRTTRTLKWIGKGLLYLCFLGALWFALDGVWWVTEWLLDPLPLSMGEALGAFSIWLTLGLVLAQNRRPDDSMWTHAKRRWRACFFLSLTTLFVVVTLFDPQTNCETSPVQNCVEANRALIAFLTLQAVAIVTGFTVGIIEHD